MKLGSFFSKRSVLSLVLGAGFLATPFALPVISQAEVTQEKFNEMLKAALAGAEGQKLVGEATESYLRQKQMEARKQQEEQAKADIESQFNNPVVIPAGTSPFKGPADAPITIIEFSDFQCPFCKRGADTMDEVMKAYQGKVKLVFKNLPLDFHDQAKPAAKAALAAGKQGKFWEMHDALFNNQRGLGDEFYLEQAKTLGLNVEQFKKDMASADLEKQIEEDVKIARAQGISGTPGFFVNGVAVKGAYPFEHFKDIIERWLAKQGKK